MKLRLVCLLLSCCLVPLAGADTVYRSVDAQGNVIFTDNPERGEPVQVAPGDPVRVWIPLGAPAEGGLIARLL